MKGTLWVLLCFAAGCLAGWSGRLPEELAGGGWAEAVLILLLLLVGMSIGSGGQLRELLRRFRWRFLWLPLATAGGTLLLSACAALLLSWSVPQCMAVGAGFGYYSLSSILITQLESASLGVQIAAELGTVALLANVFRELLTLFLAPWIVRCFGPLALISAGGATTADTTLPAVIRYSGRDYLLLSVFHGVLMDFSVPFFVSFLCAC